MCAQMPFITVLEHTQHRCMYVYMFTELDRKGVGEHSPPLVWYVPPPIEFFHFMYHRIGYWTLLTKKISSQVMPPHAILLMKT